MSYLGRAANHQPSRKIQLGSDLPTPKQTVKRPDHNSLIAKGLAGFSDRSATAPKIHCNRRVKLFRFFSANNCRQ